MLYFFQISARSHWFIWWWRRRWWETNFIDRTNSIFIEWKFEINFGAGYQWSFEALFIGWFWNETKVLKIRNWRALERGLIEKEAIQYRLIRCYAAFICGCEWMREIYWWTLAVISYLLFHPPSCNNVLAVVYKWRLKRWLSEPIERKLMRP